MVVDNYILGPIADFRRFVIGSLSEPPATRKTSEADLAFARQTLTEAGCDLSRCTETNLHFASTDRPIDELYDQFSSWQLWPRSAFFAMPNQDEAGVEWFSYRLYKLVPIVVMRMKTAVKPRWIIYDIIRGVGAGGYHSFLFDPAEHGRTKVSIFTTFPPTLGFFEGLHDQVNFDTLKQI